MKAIAIIPIVGGAPDVDLNNTPIHGIVLGGRIGSYGIYVLSGTGAQLQAVDALPGVVGIAAFTDDPNDPVKWAALDGPIPAGVRNKIDTWVANNHPAWGTIPAGWKLRDLVKFIGKKLNTHFDLASLNVADAP